MAVLLWAGVSLGACASLSGKFTATREANVGAFADNTVALLSQPNVGFEGGKEIYIREFTDPEGDEETRLKEYVATGNDIIRGIIRYSITLVNLVEESENERELIDHYADYLAKRREEVEAFLQLETGHFDEIVERVRSQEDFLGALRQAQLLLNAFGRRTLSLLDVADNAVDDLVRKIDARVDERYADVIRYQRALEREKYSILRGLERLYETNEGVEGAFLQLIDSGVIRRRSMIPEREPTEDDLVALGEYLVKRLDNVDRIWKEIEPDWTLYRSIHEELDRLHEMARQQSNRTRLIMLVWLRGHQKMAAGLTNPAEWFDVSNAPVELFSLGAKAIF